MYERKASKAFEAANKIIKKTADKIHEKHRTIFANPRELPSDNFLEIPDYHSACVVATIKGIPLHKINPGPKQLEGERIQLNYETAARKAIL